MDENKTICKPFNDTGFCGYGNSCKYLHIRINKDNLCNLCNTTEELIQSECYHYYCSNCAVKIYKEGKCKACNSKINGIFKYL